ncbi:hypothetical protein GCM10023238_02070 [Streptomyces heliomycini]
MTVGLDALTDDLHPAVLADRGHAMDRTGERIEDVAGTVPGLHGERQRVVVPAHFATCHKQHGRPPGRRSQADGAASTGAVPAGVAVMPGISFLRASARTGPMDVPASKHPATELYGRGVYRFLLSRQWVTITLVACSSSPR